MVINFLNVKNVYFYFHSTSMFVEYLGIITRLRSKVFSLVEILFKLGLKQKPKTFLDPKKCLPKITFYSKTFLVKKMGSKKDVRQTNFLGLIKLWVWKKLKFKENILVWQKFECKKYIVSVICICFFKNDDSVFCNVLNHFVTFCKVL